MRSLVSAWLWMLGLLVSAACHHTPQTEVVRVVSAPEGIGVAGEGRELSGVAADSSGVVWLVHSGCEAFKCRSLELVSATAEGKLSILHREDVTHDYPASIVIIDRAYAYLAVNKTLSRFPRGGGEGAVVLTADHAITAMAITDDEIYYATFDPDSIENFLGRVPVGGGAAPAPQRSDETIGGLVADGGRVVECLSSSKQSELWRLDGNARKIGDVPGYCGAMAIDGDRLYVTGCDNKCIVQQFVDGRGTAETQLHGALVAASAGVVYARDEASTYAIAGSAAPRRVGPLADAGVVVGDRLYGIFSTKAGDVVGSVRVRGDAE